MHKRGLRWRRVRGATHPGGDGAPPAALLPGPARDRRPGDRHGLLGAPGRAGRRQRGQGPQGPLVPRLLRHPGRRVRRRATCCTRSRASSASPTTGRSPSSASATSGQALANYRGLRRPRLPGRRRWSTPTPRRSASSVGDLTIESLDDLPTIVARPRASRSASSPRPRTPRRRWPTASSTPGVDVDPQLRPDGRVARPTGVSLRKVDLAIELQILSFYQQRRDAPRRSRRARNGEAAARHGDAVTPAGRRSRATR